MSISLLLADDSPTIAKILRMALQNEPYSIRSVETAAAALAELKREVPSLILIDLTLPEKDGYEFSTFIKNNAALRSVKVVLLSSTFDPVDEAKVAACGADGVIEKPFDPPALRAKLQAVLSASTKARSSAPPVSTAKPAVESFTKTIDLHTAAPLDLVAAAKGGAARSEDTDTAIDFGDAFANSEPTTAIDFGQTAPAATSDPKTTASATKPVAAKTDDYSELSPDAQALAAFFSAEIELHSPTPAPKKAAPAAPPSTSAAGAVNFDWQVPEASNLDQWSSQPKPSDKPAEKPAPTVASKTSTASGGSFHFDIGGSTFRFSEDYIQRITKSFSGEAHEEVPKTHPLPHQALFPQSSSDSNNKTSSDSNNKTTSTAQPSAASRNASPAASAGTPASGFKPGGGNWTAEEMKRIEQLVREEVQMVVREIVEKVAWEVIPELAENLIKRELDTVLKQIDE